MKIVIHDYGAYAFIYDLARQLAAYGDDVTYIYSGTEDQKCALEEGSCEAGSLTVVPLTIATGKAQRGWVDRYRHEKQYGQALVRALEDLPLDIALLANTPLNALALVQPALQSRGITVVNWLQDIRGFAMARILGRRLPVLGSIIGHHYLRLEQRLVRTADAIIVPSPDFLADMSHSQYRLPSAFVHPNWMPIETLSPDAKDNEWSRRFNLNETTNVCYFGTFGHKQDIDAFVTIAKHLAQHRDARLVVGSAGPSVVEFKGRLARLDLHNVVFIPWQEHRWYGQMLATADILLSVTTEEASSFSVPSKILGYLCAGRPVLAVIPHGNLAGRLLIEHDMGLVVEPHDEDGLVRALDRLLGTDGVRTTLSENARAFAEDQFDIKRNSRAIRSMIDQVLASRRAGDSDRRGA
jgi:glycosyltransferase involved in cell wall biosynthesis